jgi:hypothetical protein
MDSFGLNMYFLEIKQVSIINFILKIYFHNHLFIFSIFWIMRTITETHRGYFIKLTQTQLTTKWTTGWILYHPGSLMQKI